MKAGKSIGKKSAAASGKKEPRGKRAPLPSKDAAKKKASPPVSRKKTSAATSAPSRRPSAGKKAVEAKPEKDKKAAPGKAAPGVKKKTAPAAKASTSGTGKKTKAAPKVRKPVASRLLQRKGSARPRRRKAPAVLPAPPADEALSPPAAIPAGKPAAARKRQKDFPLPPRSALPMEYGEDDITAMVVDPHEVFAHWEIREEHLAGAGKKLILRIQDADKEGNGSRPRVKDIMVLHRIGSGFFPLATASGHVVLSMGLIGPWGRFHPIVKTGRLTVPVVMPAEEEKPRKQSLEPRRIGY